MRETFQTALANNLNAPSNIAIVRLHVSATLGFVFGSIMIPGGSRLFAATVPVVFGESTRLGFFYVSEMADLVISMVG